MEDDLNFSGNGRQPPFSVNGSRLQFLRKWKTTSTSEKWNMTPIFQEKEDDLHYSGKGRRPKFFRKWKMTSIFQEIEDDYSFQ